MACEEFIYSEDNFNLMSFWSDKTQSNFEQILQDTWEAKLKKNVFRYKLNITQSKVLPGKYKFVLKVSFFKSLRKGSLYFQVSIPPNLNTN